MTAPSGRAVPVPVDVAAATGGYAVTVGGRIAKTPGKRPMVVPHAALAREIADEVTQLVALAPNFMAGKGPSDPTQAPNFRIAAAAIDGIAGKSRSRAQLITELAAYGETDLVCYRAARPQGLVADEEAVWTPLLDWFKAEFGVGLNVTTGLRAVPQAAAALESIVNAIKAHDDFALAALSLATRSAGSIVIGLALSRGRLNAQAAFRAATVDETYQAGHWGADEDATRALEAKALDLAQAARFFELSAKG